MKAINWATAFVGFATALLKFYAALAPLMNR